MCTNPANGWTTAGPVGSQLSPLGGPALYAAPDVGVNPPTTLILVAGIFLGLILRQKKVL